MKKFKPNHIYIEKAAREHPHAQEILDRLGEIEVTEVKNRHELLRELKVKPDPMGAGKRSLLLAYDDGETFKPFRESEEYLSCDYFTLHAEEGCDLECSYCFLQEHLTSPLLTVYTHLDEMLKKLKEFLANNPEKKFRIGTGQLADSLSLDHITFFSERLVPFFAEVPNATLELKTKSDNIDRLLKLAPKGRTIVSWSLNSKKIQEEEEHKCATIKERIVAAKKLIDAADYRLGFHFDPIIDYPGWEKDYEEVVDLLFQNIPANKIAWMSLGCFRGEPKLKQAIQKRFPNSQVPLGEMIRGLDGKMRYFKPRRIEIYKKMTKMIQKHAAETTLYLSMELPEVWREVFGKDYSKDAVCEMLDGAAGLLS